MDQGTKYFLKYLSAHGYDPGAFQSLPISKQKEFRDAWDRLGDDYDNAIEESEDHVGEDDYDGGMENLDNQMAAHQDGLAQQFGVSGHRVPEQQLRDNLMQVRQEQQEEMNAGMPPQLDHYRSGFENGEDHSPEPSGSSGYVPNPPNQEGVQPLGPNEAGRPLEVGDDSLYQRWKDQALKNPPRLVFPK